LAPTLPTTLLTKRATTGGLLINQSYLISTVPVCWNQIRGTWWQRLVRVFSVCDVKQFGL